MASDEGNIESETYNIHLRWVSVKCFCFHIPAFCLCLCRDAAVIIEVCLKVGSRFNRPITIIIITVYKVSFEIPYSSSCMHLFQVSL